MTDAVLVWDTTGPLHASRAARAEILVEAAGLHRRHVLTDVVADELVGKGQPVPTWAEAAALEDLEELSAFATWMTRIGTDQSNGHNMGEAATLAWAEVHGATAIIDDKKARLVARRLRKPGDAWCVHGVLWAVAREVVDERRDSPKACSGFCDQMLATGINWPLGPGGYPGWFESNRSELFTSCCSERKLDGLRQVI